jgi:hypothetical protein
MKQKKNIFILLYYGYLVRSFTGKKSTFLTSLKVTNWCCFFLLLPRFFLYLMISTHYFFAPGVCFHILFEIVINLWGGPAGSESGLGYKISIPMRYVRLLK